ncbi:glycosyl transferase [Hoeflea sp. YIM 152468]|uniref:glycosyl transferase n=1 Tax=Hoeflea sp. YIM 152468 TaxID=3031759 RepID=UPI0023DBAB34|nr:glycosyl transferase [Hoeflea sp. YIM 152468]MDF1606625.1 glycosyl transferase [Hoeflea sp. YIM 152468]
MITVLIECKDQENALAVTLAALVPGAVEGLVAEVVILDRGSSDGTEQLAEAAGCRFLVDPDLRDVVGAVRGDWVFLIEPGARPLLGWIDHIGQHMAAGRQAARMRPSRNYRLPVFKRWFRGRVSALEHGVLMPKPQAIANAKSGHRLESLGRGLAMTRLDCEIIPASVLASG